MTGREGARSLAAVRARAAELQAVIDAAGDEATARRAADELHALLDGVDNVDVLPDRAQSHPGPGVRVLRQATTLDRLLSVVANEHNALLHMAGVTRPRVGGGR